MAIYRIATPATGTGGAGSKVHQAFASSEGAAKKERRRLAEAHGFKLDEVKYKPIDLKSGKAGFIAYMNRWNTELPGDYNPAAATRAEIPAEEVAPPAAARKKKKAKGKKEEITGSGREQPHEKDHRAHAARRGARGRARRSRAASS